MANETVKQTCGASASERRATYTGALNKSLEIFVSHAEEAINDVMSNGLRPIADAADLDRIVIFRVWSRESESAGEIYRWEKEKGGSVPVDEELKILPITKAVKRWMYAISDGSCISLRRGEFTEDEAAFLVPRDVKSILIVPVFTKHKFWGVVTFHDNTNERDFDDACTAMLRSAAHLCANTLIVEEKTRSAEDAAKALKRREKMLDVLNEAAIMFLAQRDESFEDMMTEGVRLIADVMGLDRVSVWRNFQMPDDLYTSQIYRWTRTPGETIYPTARLGNISYSNFVPRWEGLLSGGKSINSPVKLLPEAALLQSFGCVSLFVAPVLMDEEFWGCVFFEDLRTEHYFDDDSADIMRSAAFLCANTVTMYEMIERRRDEGRRLEGLVAERTGELNRQNLLLKEATDEARNASEAKSRFLANMSHEMRTPMNVIVGLTDLMLEEDDIPVKTGETLQKINTAGNTLMGLINDVLDISKVEAGKLELKPVQYDVASLLNDIITLNMIRIESKPITFKLDIDNNLPRSLSGDDLRIKQILNNLLSNAFKYTKKGNVTLGVNCRRDGRRHGDDIWVSFYVSDTGMGIRAEDMEKLFKEFNQVDTRTNREIEGTGLGLSITKRFVELMGGEVSVESEYGKGSTFRVSIRQGFVTDETISKETLESLCTFHYSNKGKPTQERLVRPDLSYARVLVVDDFPTNLDVAAGMLRKYKMQVDCVTSGREAIDLIVAGEPVYDAVFMDHMMPELDGVEATAAIRALGTKYAENIPIIALTANAITGNEQMFLDNGFSAFLPKPISVMNLDSVIQKWIRKK